MLTLRELKKISCLLILVQLLPRKRNNNQYIILTNNPEIINTDSLKSSVILSQYHLNVHLKISSDEHSLIEKKRNVYGVRRNHDILRKTFNGNISVYCGGPKDYRQTTLMCPVIK